jgi:hypothetical protein
MSLQLFKDDRAIRNVTIPDSRHEEDEPFGEIRCPLCGWRPLASSRWYCAGAGTPESGFTGCGTSWNTFLTRGRCPGCDHQWKWTSCHQCKEWSLHEDWYAAETS